MGRSRRGRQPHRRRRSPDRSDGDHALAIGAGAVPRAAADRRRAPPPAAKILAGLPAASAAASTEGWSDAARAILTTDTFPKGATRSAKIDGVPVTLNGFAKGSGMIAPDMATMLAYVFTDAAIPAPALQALLREAAERSFNSITVDGDTSTSDTVLLCASQQAPHRPVVSPQDPRLED